MYNSFFGFQDKPFNVTPDPRFYYANRSYREGYASLLYGIQERKGFIVLTGEVGVGKTTLLRRLINNLGPDVHFSFLYNTNLSFDELLEAICEDLGLDVTNLDRQGKIKSLNTFLIERLNAGETVAALIDEAQNLRTDVLEELRILSNLETSSEKLLQIILVGQPELDEKLNRQDLRQLKQRIAIRCRLRALPQEEIGQFIGSRLETVGYQGSELFDPGATRAIAHYSRGLPRLINNICDNALLIAFASQQHQVTGDIVEEVATDLGLAQSAERRAQEEEAERNGGAEGREVSGERNGGAERRALSGERDEENGEGREAQGVERRAQGYEARGVEWRGENSQPGEGLEPPVDASEARDRELRERYFGRGLDRDNRQSAGQIGRFFLAACALLIFVAGTVYVANPYEIRQRLASSGLSVDRVEAVIEYLGQKLNGVLNSANIPSEKIVPVESRNAQEGYAIRAER